jgi:23S rRNA (pseudouridine1915-N3)-methyltransferase
MLNIRIVCVGNLKESYLKEGIAEYAKRMTGKCDFKIVELKEEKVPENPSAGEIAAALDKEAAKIIDAVKGSYRIAMCVEAKQVTSEGMAEMIERAAMRSSTVSFIIGSSHGLSDKVKNACEEKLSVSKLTYPHQLMRLMLTESIYRSLSIIAGSKYHK